MLALPLAARLAIAGVLLASVVAGWMGPPPRRARRRASRLLVAFGVGADLIGSAALAFSHAEICALLVAIGIEATSLGVWLGRGDDGRDDDEDVEPPDDPPGEGERPPADWDDFDRLRRDWERSRDRPSEPVPA